MREEGVGEITLQRDIGLIERGEVIDEIGAAGLGALGLGGGGKRNADRARDVAEQDVKRGRIGVAAARQGGVGERAVGHEEEGEPESLGGAHRGERPIVDVGDQGVGVGERRPEREEAEEDEVAGLDAPHEAADDGDEEENEDRTGGEEKPGQHRGVAELLLGELWDQHRARIEDRADHEDHQRAEREVAVA